MHVPGDVLDLILIVLAAAFAVAGYRQGFIIGVLSFIGFIGGVAVGAVFAPRISRGLAASLPWQAFIAILVVFGAAVLGMVIASGLGVTIRSRVTGRPATVIDSLGGAAVNVIAVLLVAWLIGSFVAYSPFPEISGQVNHSAVLKAVDKVVPHDALSLPGFPPLRSLLTSGPYTQVFSALGAESALAVPPPDPAVLQVGRAGRGPQQHRQDRRRGTELLRGGSRARASSSRLATSSPTRTWWPGSPRARPSTRRTATRSRPRWCCTTRRSTSRCSRCRA